MKTRNGFVSNSSSSSFVIVGAGDLKVSQVEKIKNHIHYNNRLKDSYGCDEGDAWSITVSEDGERISGYTSMDNFNMRAFLEDYLGIDPNKIEWEYDG